MRTKMIAPMILAIAMMSVACGQKTTQPEKGQEGQKEAREVEKDGRELRSDIAEMIVVGFRGLTVESSKHIERDIKRYGVGGVILFEYDAPTGTHKRNVSSPEQLEKLCQELQSISEETLLIGIDQEGGRVNRLRRDQGFPKFMSAKKSAEYGEDSIRYTARLTAKELRKAGVNLNFAPCVDVDVNENCPVIGKLERSFSKDENEVTDAARIWVAEQRKAGIVSCLKHFPGHGSAKGDTHIGLVDVSESWEERELKPYEVLTEEGNVDMIMTAHVMNSKLDKKYPASLSYNITTKLLRERMGYDGVVITDDLAMGAIVNQYGYEEALRLAIEAGADLLCLSNNGKEYNPEIVPETIRIVEQLVRDGKIKAERIMESAKRVRALKAKMKE